MFGGDEWLIIAIVALVLFGGSQLPKLARNLGEAQRELKKAMHDGAADDEEPPAPAAAPVTPPPAATVSPPAHATDSEIVDAEVVEAEIVEPVAPDAEATAP
jgi:sec-independent protein translocase protein TatA